MIEGSMTRRIGGTVLAFTAVLLAVGCGPVYLSDTYATSTPRPASFDVGALAGEPVATLGLVAPANLQGFSPTVSLALATALAEVSPPIRRISTFETVNRLTDQGLAAEYADLLSGFVRNGILERQRLRRIGSGLGARYVMLPGLAQLDETVIDKFEAAGLKLLRNRVTTLRLWLQLWDAQWGHMVWESAGEVTVSTVLLSPKQTVPLEETVQKLLFNMIQDGLLRGKPKPKITSIDGGDGARATRTASTPECPAGTERRDRRQGRQRDGLYGPPRDRGGDATYEPTLDPIYANVPSQG